MAAPSSEQSENMSKDSNKLDQDQEQPSFTSNETPMEPESKEDFKNVQEPIPMAEPEKKELVEPSAFHVVSYPDGHKEVTTDLLQTCNPSSQLETSAPAGYSLEPPGPGEAVDVPKETVHVKHFSAKVVQQEQREDNPLSKEIEDANMTEAEENQIQAENENEAVAMEGVNIEDIDDAVERALLGEVGEDSCGKSAGENSIELEGLQAKTTDLNGGYDSPSGQNDGSGDPEGTPQTHRIEKVYNIDEETRMGLDATPVSDQSMLKESFIYPSLPPKKLFQIEETKDSEASDTETKMSMSMTDTEDIRLSHTVSIDDNTNVSVTSDSNTEAPTPSSTRKPFRATREGIGVSHDGLSEGGERVFTAENLFEYQWPLDGGEWHLLQEQVSEYLRIKSFKRKYPDLDRRVCDKEEKDFLRDKGVVTETQSDLGLTALRSEEVYDLMMKDYNDKYQEYITVLQEKQKKGIREKHKEYSEQAKIDKSKMESYSKKAARSAAEFNANMMREKKDERRAYFDLQTYTVHFPKNKFATLPPRKTKIGAYPVAVLTGQYQDRYRKYSPEELKYFPVKTVLQDPRKPVKYVRPMPESVRLAILEKQKPPPSPPPPPQEDMMETNALDNSENKENAIIPESATAVTELDSAAPVTELSEPVTPLVKIEKKPSMKSSSKKRPKIELSPERPKKTFKKARESLRAAEAATAAEDSVAPDGVEANKADGKNLLPKIHGLEKCRICKQRSTKEERKNEKIIKCAQCGKIGHTNCLDLTEELVAVIKTYPWQCMECKTCVKCMDPFDEDKMMFCDRCDRGYHTFCIGLEALPTGHWECGNCDGVPSEVVKKKSETATDKNISEVETSEQIKSETVDPSSSPMTKNYALTEPTLKEKQELLEEGEIPAGALTPATPGLGLGLSGATLAITPASSLKIERRGRKRKYPIDPDKPKVSHKKAKSLDTPKQVTGERQSKRLKLKEEEEEEKKKKVEEKREKKEKKKQKLLRRMASEAAAAAAVAAAEAYAASHPDEDCVEMIAQAKAMRKDVPLHKTEKAGEGEMIAQTEAMRKDDVPPHKMEKTDQVKDASAGISEGSKSSDAVAESVGEMIAQAKAMKREDVPSLKTEKTEGVQDPTAGLTESSKSSDAAAESVGEMIAQAKAMRKDEAPQHKTEKTEGVKDIFAGLTESSIPSDASVTIVAEADSAVAGYKPVSSKTNEESPVETSQDPKIDTKHLTDTQSASSQPIDQSSPPKSDDLSKASDDKISTPLQSTDIPHKGNYTTCPPQAVDLPKKDIDQIPSHVQSTVLSKEETEKLSTLAESADFSEKDADNISSSLQSANQATEGDETTSKLPQTDDSHQTSEEAMPLPNKEKPDSNMSQTPHTFEEGEHQATISSSDVSSLSPSNKQCDKEVVKDFPDHIQYGIAKQDSEKPVEQKEPQETNLPVEGTSQKTSKSPLCNVPSPIQQEPEIVPKSTDTAPDVSTSDHTVLDNPVPNPTESTVEKEKPSCPRSIENSDLDIQTKPVHEKIESPHAQEESKEITETPSVKSNVEPPSSLESTEQTKISEPTETQSPSDNALQHESQESVEPLSLSAATSNREDSVITTQTSKLSEDLETSETDYPQLSTSGSTSLPPPSIATTEKSSISSSSDPLPPPSQAETSDHTSPINISLPTGSTEGIIQESKPLEEVVSDPPAGDSEEGK